MLIIFLFRCFLLSLQAIRYSTSYHNKAICRRILSYMPSSEGIIVFRCRRQQMKVANYATHP